MFRKLLCALAALLLVTPSFAAVPQQLYQTGVRSIVTLYAANERGNIERQGTGFFVNSDGDILTNSHVMGYFRGGEAELPDGERILVREVIAQDDAKDLALLRTVVPHGLVIYPVTFATKREPLKSPVYVIGTPEGRKYTLSEGAVKSYRKNGNYRELLTSAKIKQGNSGSPVFNQRGEVTGIASGVLSVTTLFGRKDVSGYGADAAALLEFIRTKPTLSKSDLEAKKREALYERAKLNFETAAQGGYLVKSGALAPDRCVIAKSAITAVIEGQDARYTEKIPAGVVMVMASSGGGREVFVEPDTLSKITSGASVPLVMGLLRASGGFEWFAGEVRGGRVVIKARNKATVVQAGALAAFDTVRPADGSARFAQYLCAAAGRVFFRVFDGRMKSPEFVIYPTNKLPAVVELADGMTYDIELDYDGKGLRYLKK